MIFENREETPLAKAIIITILFVLLSKPTYLLIAYLFVIIIMLCKKLIFAPGYSFGLSPTLSAKTKKTLLIIVSASIGLNVVLAAAILLLKMLAFSHDPSGYFELYQMAFAMPKELGPDTSIHSALMLFDFSRIGYFLLKPFVYAIILAPIFESIVIFNILLLALKPRMKKWTLIILLSVIFTGLHVTQATSLGLLIILISAPLDAWLYLKTGSLYPTLVYHACWNATMVFQVTVMNLGFLPPPI